MLESTSTLADLNIYFWHLNSQFSEYKSKVQRSGFVTQTPFEKKSLGTIDQASLKNINIEFRRKGFFSIVMLQPKVEISLVLYDHIGLVDGHQKREGQS